MKRLLFLLTLLPSVAAAQDFRYVTTQTLTPFPVANGTPNLVAIDASNDGVAGIFIAREAATITSICYDYGVRTGTPPAYKVGLETVSTANGDPSTTYKTGTGECSATFTPPADTSIDNTKVCKTLTGTTCALTRGEVFAVTIRYSSGTIDGSNNSSFAHSWNSGYNDNPGGVQAQTGNNEYADTLAAGTWSKQPNIPLFSFANGTRTFGNPMTVANQRGFSSDSTPDERALRFQYPCPTGQQYQISGISWGGDQTCNTSKSVKVQLYTGTTVLQDVTVDCDQAKSLTANRTTLAYFDEATLSDLDCGTTYRVSLAPQETSSGLSIASFEVSTNADFDAWPWGKETYMSYRTDAGAWTDVTTERPSFALIIDNLNTVSAGGTVYSPSLDGGMQ